jgi:hypothetical protein
MVELQQKLMVAKVGTADAGPWHYSYVYDLFVRAYPEQVEAARYLTPRRARQAILGRYVRTAAATSVSYAAWLLGWSQDDTQRAADDLEEAGDLIRTAVAGWEGEHLVDKARPAVAAPAGAA